MARAPHLPELGRRLADARVARNLTQAALAERAGVAKRTVERLESGAVGTQLSAFLRVLAGLGLDDRLDLLVPPTPPSPIAQLKLEGRRPKRATGTRGHARHRPKRWTWGDQ